MWPGDGRSIESEGVLKMNLIENEKDRKEFTKLIKEAVRPLKKAMLKFQRTISKIDWERLTEELKKGERQDKP